MNHILFSMALTFCMLVITATQMHLYNTPHRPENHFWFYMAVVTNLIVALVLSACYLIRPG